jgi:hypothetical protein
MILGLPYNACHDRRRWTISKHYRVKSQTSRQPQREKMSTRRFSKREQAIGIGLTFGLITGLVIGSITGNMGWWVWLGLTVGICIGAACFFKSSTA